MNISMFSLKALLTAKLPYKILRHIYDEPDCPDFRAQISNTRKLICGGGGLGDSLNHLIKILNYFKPAQIAYVHIHEKNMIEPQRQLFTAQSIEWVPNSIKTVSVNDFIFYHKSMLGHIIDTSWNDVYDITERHIYPTIEPFVKIQFPETGMQITLPEEYICVQVNAGQYKHGGKGKSWSSYERLIYHCKRIHKKQNVPIVFIGDDTGFNESLPNESWHTNLVPTDLGMFMRAVAGARLFIGLQGFGPIFATNQKVPSIIQYEYPWIWNSYHPKMTYYLTQIPPHREHFLENAVEMAYEIYNPD